MPLTAHKRYPNRVARRKIPGVGAETDRPRRTEILVEEGTPTSATQFTIQFNQKVSVAGLPNYTFTPAAVISSVSLGGGGSLLVINHATATITGFSIPFEDPCVRNLAGGFVRPGDYEAA